jgi:hypothetical protein
VSAPAAEARRVVIVPCGGKKAQVSSIEAGALYLGSYHAATRRAANVLTSNGQTGMTLILSARYGLVTLDRVIEPYDLRAGQPGSITAGQVRAQAGELGILDAEVTVLAGRAYSSLVVAVWPGAADLLAGTRGIGQQLARLAAIYRQ